MKKLWISALCLVLVLGLAACGFNPAPPVTGDDSDPPAVSDTVPGGAVGGDTDGDGNSMVNGNVVDGGLFFGDDTTTTTTAAPTTTTTAAKGDGNTTTTTTAAPTTTTTTTKKPTTTTVAPPQQEDVQNVSLPAAGYDIDGKKRIFVTDAAIQKSGTVKYAVLTFANQSKDNGKEWIIEETAKVTYTCYDKKGKEIGTGTMVLGALEYGESTECKVELPSGTAELKITGHNLVYWTPWS